MNLIPFSKQVSRKKKNDGGKYLGVPTALHNTPTQ